MGVVIVSGQAAVKKSTVTHPSKPDRATMWALPAPVHIRLIVRPTSYKYPTNYAFNSSTSPPSCNPQTLHPSASGSSWSSFPPGTRTSRSVFSVCAYTDPRVFQHAYGAGHPCRYYLVCPSVSSAKFTRSSSHAQLCHSRNVQCSLQLGSWRS